MQEDSLNFDQPSVQPVRLIEESAHVSLHAPADESYPLAEIRNEQYLGQIIAGLYRLDNVIGSGGMSIVFSGLDLRSQK